MIVWRGFSAYGQAELAFLRGKHASKDYINYIKTIFGIFTPFANIRHKNDFDFHQDTPQRRRWHFFLLKIMEWAACSADLNLMSCRQI